MHRHALMACIAFAYLQPVRLKVVRRREKGRGSLTASGPPRRSRACPLCGAPCSVGWLRLGLPRPDVRTALLLPINGVPASDIAAGAAGL